MSKDAEISILLECAEKLGRDSYCQAWLLDQIPFIQRDIRNDIIPQIGWAETRKLEQGAIDLANQQAKRIIDQATAEAKKIQEQATRFDRDTRSCIANELRR